MTEAPAIRPHPLEQFPGATRTVTAPMTGLPVLIRKVDYDVITLDCTKTVLSSPAMRAVAQGWAEEAGKEMQQPGEQSRPRGELPPEMGLEIQRQSELALLRSALLRPTLDELVALYGGDMQTPDLGLGPDFSYLAGEVDDFSKPKPAPEQLEAARTFPVPAGGGAAQPGEGVQQEAERTGEDGAGDA